MSNNKKSLLSIVWWLSSESMADKAPTIDKRFDNGKFAVDFEVSMGQAVGLGFTLDWKNVRLTCGHPFGGVRLDVYLGPISVGLALTSSYAAHAKFHEELELEQKPIDTHPLPFTEEQLRQADIEGLEELKAMANQMGMGVEKLIDGLPEPLRSEMLRRLGISPDVPEVTATQVNEALEAIRMGRAGQ